MARHREKIDKQSSLIKRHRETVSKVEEIEISPGSSAAKAGSLRRRVRERSGESVAEMVDKSWS